MSAALVQLGWLDTNLFIHVLFPADPHYARCRLLIRALEEGRAEGWIDVTTVHELTYVLGRLPGYPDRTAIADYIDRVLQVSQIRADDKPALREALARWVAQGGFVDAWLAVIALRRGLPICSVNTRDFPPSLDNSFLTATL